MYAVGSTTSGKWMHLVDAKTGLTVCSSRPAVFVSDEYVRAFGKDSAAPSCHRCRNYTGKEWPLYQGE